MKFKNIIYMIISIILFGLLIYINMDKQVEMEDVNTYHIMYSVNCTEGEYDVSEELYEDLLFTSNIHSESIKIRRVGEYCYTKVTSKEDVMVDMLTCNMLCVDNFNDEGVLYACCR